MSNVFSILLSILSNCLLTDKFSQLDIIDKNLGLSVTVEIEGSNTHKLQVKSLISTQHNSSLPAYAPFNSQNSEKLPAQFVLKLSQPFPMLNTSINQIINEINEPATIKEYLTTLTNNSKESLVSLIARQELDLNKGPFCRSVDVFKSSENDTCDLRKHVYSIKLLDQYHTYHILDSYLERQDGVYVTKIPFTHPTSIPNILRVLRQQALFNFFIGSCIRRNKNSNNISSDENASKNTHESNIFDITPISLNNICISFEHPSKESLATLEIDFKELSCQLYALDKESVCSNEFATKVLQKCWSIPITLRSVLKKCNERRLEILEDASKRRERELQELLATNSAQQGPLQFKSHLQYQETLLQNKFNNISEKSNPRDLNSIAEFLTSKLSGTGTSDASNQTSASIGADGACNRSNLLKKFSCKPKARQNTATKNQTGNKILSLMLKRQNSSTSSNDDASLKATIIKKVKTKNPGDSSLRGTSTGVTTTKLISSEVANAARLASKQAKQGSNSQNISLSLIRSPSKAQQASLISSSSSASSMSVGVSLMPQAGGTVHNSKQVDPSLYNISNMNSTNLKIKNPNNSNNSNAGKARKSSIGAVLDKLVGGVTPDQNSLSSQANSSNDSTSSESGLKNVDSSKGSPSGVKIKSRTPGDSFAIKQGSVGSLKLTVTKTKPAVASPSTSTTSTTSTPTTTFSSSTSSASLPSNLKNSEVSKILGLGSSAPATKYTIPKIPKTQQASQSGPSNQANSTDNQSSSTNESVTTPNDESGNPSSSANSSAPSSTTIKRTTSTPFNRTNSSVRNPVSSSTHPLGRTTSNPLANANSRPSSTSTNDNHLLNRISSSNQGQQNMRQQISNRMMNIQQQQLNVQRTVVGQGMLNAQQQPPQPNQQPMFALGLSQQQGGLYQNKPDINMLAANQAALLNQQRNHNSLSSLQLPGPMFMSSSVDANLISSSRPHFAVSMTQQPQQQSMNITPTTNGNVCDSLQRPSTSVINATPQFYIRQPMFEETSNAVSSTPRITSEASQSSIVDQRKVIDSTPQQQQQQQQHQQQQQPPTSITASMNSFQQKANENLSSSNTTMTSPATIETSSSTTTGLNIVGGNLGVSSSSDSDNHDIGPTISTPSSPTECGHAETVPPPPLIPIDSLEEPMENSQDSDHPDDASDRLSIVDTNENIADSNSLAGTPKPSIVSSPVNNQESASFTPSSSRNLDSAASSVFGSQSQSSESISATPSAPNELPNSIQSPVGLPAVTSTPANTMNSGCSEDSSTPYPQSSSLVSSEESSNGLQSLPIQSSTSDSVASNDNDSITPQSTMTATTSEI